MLNAYDWQPQTSAVGRPDGERRRGSTGQLFEAKNGQWIRVPAEHTPGPWEYVPSTEHHGPYVTSQFGNTLCDCYAMSHPSEPSTASGGPSRPIPFMHEMADPNARLIAAAPDLLAALRLLADYGNDSDGLSRTDYQEALEVARAAIERALGLRADGANAP